MILVWEGPQVSRWKAAQCLGRSLVLFSSTLCPRSAEASEPTALSADLWTRAAALRPDAAQGRQLYDRFCTRCHRAEGSATGGGQYPQLGGQREDYLLKQLVELITLDRLAPRMHEVLQQAPLSDPQSLRDLSFYLAIQTHETHGESGDGHNLGRGRQLYVQLCANCHGKFGEGRPEGPTPAVGGQNYTYLREQVSAFAGGHRAMVEPALMDTMRRLSNADVRAVADYMSQMPASVDVRYGVIGP